MQTGADRVCWGGWSSFSTWPGMLSGPAAIHGLIIDRVFLTSAGDRQSAWSLGGVGSFCAGVSFCISNRE